MQDQPRTLFESTRVKRLVLTTRELATVLGVSRITILRWKRQGKLPKPRFDGAVIRWLTKDIEDWLANDQATKG